MKQIISIMKDSFQSLHKTHSSNREKDSISEKCCKLWLLCVFTNMTQPSSQLLTDNKMNNFRVTQIFTDR